MRRLEAAQRKKLKNLQQRKHLENIKWVCQDKHIHPVHTQLPVHVCSWHSHSYTWNVYLIIFPPIFLPNLFSIVFGHCTIGFFKINFKLTHLYFSYYFRYLTSGVAILLQFIENSWIFENISGLWKIPWKFNFGISYENVSLIHLKWCN